MKMWVSKNILSESRKALALSLSLSSLITNSKIYKLIFKYPSQSFFNRQNWKDSHEKLKVAEESVDTSSKYSCKI